MVQNQGSAAAVFVKTLGMTPLKTRLAKGCGEEKAHEFYRKSCASLKELLINEPSLKGFWSVAEGEAAFDKWTELETMGQGSGDLGDRLHYVYQNLRQNYEKAYLLGADSPQISSQIFSASEDKLAHHDFVIGPARDGGFYLFAGRKTIPEPIWTSVAYSAKSTAKDLAKSLESIGTVAWLGALQDIDETKDIKQLIVELETLASQALPKQAELLVWLKANDFETDS